jgi:hypothetical protein
MLILAGAVLMVIGVVISLGGRLPGDIVVRGKNTTFYFPVVTCLVISAVLTLLSWLFSRR